MNEAADLQSRPLIRGLIGDVTVRTEWLILILVVLVAFVIRVYRLGDFPDTLLADEVENAQSSVEILNGHPPSNGFFGLDWTDQPALSAYKEAAFIAIFGFNILAIRLSSAVISALALIPFYFLLRYQLSVLSSILATILLATNVWFLNFSRSGWNCIDIGFYMLMAMLFLLLALRAMHSSVTRFGSDRRYFALSGFFCALGLYGYPAGRAITLAVIAFFPFAIIFYHSWFKRLILGYLFLFIVEAVLFAPQAFYIVQNLHLFTGRTDVVLIFNDPDYKADPLGTMIKKLSDNLQGPWSGSVNNTPQYSPGGEPQLDTVTGVLALIGMILTFVDRKFRSRPETWLWWLMLLSGWGMTQLFTAQTPNGARGIGYMPTLIYYAGVGLDMFVMDLSYLTSGSRRPRLSGRLAGALIILAILAVGVFNVKHYVDWQNKPETRWARYLYITSREFPKWSAVLEDRIKTNRPPFNVGDWRVMYPLVNISDPYGFLP
jgi:4-amino-4-deoxy-L-arabinose transferase-like glycosyltransferase